MKTSILLLSSLAGTVLANPAITDRITPEELASRPMVSPLAALKPAGTDGDGAATRSPAQSLIEQSEILSDGYNWTLVPKGAVLFVPGNLKARVGAKPLGTLLNWNDFIAVNLGWVFTEEVTLDQATGKRAIPDSRKDFWDRNGKVIVAIHLGGPISVRPEAIHPGDFAK